jgi:erythronate-4-phosphate dehydrogenase
VKIVADQNMLMIAELFGHAGEIYSLPGRQICAADVADADVLLVRSVTRVDEALLRGSKVAFVGSATIGTDHIDLDYLQQRGITFAHAPGCNAYGVVQYVLSVLCRLQPDWAGKNIGIVGGGNVGGLLYRILTDLNVPCAVYDPFLAPSVIPDLVDFEGVLKSDIICMHTPLTTGGEHPTHHVFNRDVLTRLPANVLLINAGRGAVIDNVALLDHLSAGAALRVALDVWEPEPNINRELMALVQVATPHIAGYSYEGKVKGSQMVAEAFYLWHTGSNVTPRLPRSDRAALLGEESLNALILATYDVLADDRRMREAMRCDSDSVARQFDQLRKEYPERHEFSHYRTALTSVIADYASVLGFRV